MEMHERITSREAEKAFNVAMTACQGDLRKAGRAGRRQPADAQQVRHLREARQRPAPDLHEARLRAFLRRGHLREARHRARDCIVSHVGGHSRTYHRDMPADGKGAKGGDVMTKTHAAGAAGSYGARYLLKGIFNVAIGEYDNDGNGRRQADGRGRARRPPGAIDARRTTRTLKNLQARPGRPPKRSATSGMRLVSSSTRTRARKRWGQRA
jgi:hypothetical protein